MRQFDKYANRVPFIKSFHVICLGVLVLWVYVPPIATFPPNCECLHGSSYASGRRNSKEELQSEIALYDHDVVGVHTRLALAVGSCAGDR